MAVTIVKFRADFPEFTDTVVWPDAQIQFYLDLALLLLGDRWGNIKDFGIELFAAHNLSVEFEAKRAAARGQNPGQVISPITGGAVDKVSYQRAASSILDPKNGHWNLSQYGLRYINLVNLVGAGPVQISPGCIADSSLSYPWPGPIGY